MFGLVIRWITITNSGESFCRHLFSSIAIILDLIKFLTNPGESIRTAQGYRNQNSCCWAKDGLGLLYSTTWFFLYGFWSYFQKHRQSKEVKINFKPFFPSFFAPNTWRGLMTSDCYHVNCSLFEEGGDWERKNRLKVYEGLYCMSTRNFKKAANLFLDSISTFTTYELFPYDTFIFYTVLTSIISLDRVSLKQKVFWIGILSFSFGVYYCLCALY